MEAAAAAPAPAMAAAAERQQQQCAKHWNEGEDELLLGFLGSSGFVRGFVVHQGSGGSSVRSRQTHPLAWAPRRFRAHLCRSGNSDSLIAQRRTECDHAASSFESLFVLNHFFFAPARVNRAGKKTAVRRGAPGTCCVRHAIPELLTLRHFNVTSVPRLVPNQQ